MTRLCVYVAHPVSGNVDANVRNTLRWLSWLMATEPGVAFVAPWIPCLLAGADDSDPKQRERGMLDNLALVERCDGIVLVGGRVSTGMQREANVALLAGRWVADLTSLGAKPPSSPWEGALSTYGGRT